MRKILAKLICIIFLFPAVTYAIQAKLGQPTSTFDKYLKHYNRLIKCRKKIGVQNHPQAINRAVVAVLADQCEQILELKKQTNKQNNQDFFHMILIALLYALAVLGFFKK